MIMFAVIRAVVIAGTVALAFGADLSHGHWMPIAAIVAMKPSLEQTTPHRVAALCRGPDRRRRGRATAADPRQ
jgi:predicted ABC-type sugar transport system permease subunit